MDYDPEPEYEPEFDDDDGDDDCGMFEDGGVYVCSDVGSEDCEFCQFNDWLGKTSAEIDEEIDTETP